MKTKAHSLLMSYIYIVSIQVDEQGLDIFKTEKACIYPLPLTMSYEVKHEEKWFWVSNMEISKTSEKLHLE